MTDVKEERAPAKVSGNTMNDPLAALKKRHKNIPIAGDAVEFHDRPKIVLPQGMTFKRAIETFTQLQADAETLTAWDREFRYRADDMAYAAYMVIQNRYGMLLGKTTKAMMGTAPSETKTINIGVGQKLQLPWGRLEIPVFEGLELVLGETMDKDYGRIGMIHAQGPRKYKTEVDDFYNAIEEYLKTNSIYRGRAIIGSNDPEFLDLSSFRADQIVFSDEVTKLLRGAIFAPIRHAKVLEAEGVSQKRAVLLYGPFGTGKTSAGQMTAEVAVECGWTFLSAKPGRDNVEDALRTARLYEPAVVFIEDIDGAASVGEASEVTQLLDAFDGITAKGGRLMVVMTTNSIEKIHKGMLRPGRLDATIPIAGLDRNGIERLIKAVVDPRKLAGTIDYDDVAEAMDGFLPAYVKETLVRAVTFAIDRLNGEANYVIDTPDLVYAAQSLRPQYELQEVAGTGERRPALDQAYRTASIEAAQAAITGMEFRPNPETGNYQLRQVGTGEDEEV